jgi:hypothetical protein
MQKLAEQEGSPPGAYISEMTRMAVLVILKNYQVRRLVRVEETQEVSG